MWYLSHSINGALAELVGEVVSFYEADAVFALHYPNVSHNFWEKVTGGEKEKGTGSYRDGSLHFDGPLDHPVHDVLGNLALRVAVE